MHPAKELGLRQNIIAGIRRGVRYATIASVIAVVVSLLSTNPLAARRGLGLVQIIVLYYVGAGIAGAIAGALKPLRSTLVGAAVVGFVAALPATWLVAVSLAKASARYDIGPDLYWAVLLAAAVLGPMYSAIDWYYSHKA